MPVIKARLLRPRRRLARGPSASDRSSPITRRTLLRGVFQGSAVALSLPLLEISMGRQARAGAGFPRRFGLYYWGNGNLPDHWTPEGTGSEWTPSPLLEPLKGLTDVVSVISGMTVKVENTEAHGSGAAGLLSGAALELVGDDTTFAGPSIDQVIADEIGGETLYRSLQTGATDVSGVSYNGPSSLNPPETDPYALYERLFGDTFLEPGEEGVVDPALGLRRSILDAVMDDISALQGRLGSADSERLEQHLDGIRELEQRLARLQEDPPDLESCARAAAPSASYPDEEGRPQISARSRAMCDLLAMSLACDQTRIFGHYLTDPVSDVLFPDASAGHHDLTHNESGDQPECFAITLQCIEEYAYLLTALRSIPEGDGTLLDNCAVLGVSEVSLGQTHSLDDMPILLAGGAGGALLPGYHYASYSQESASKVMLTILQAMGILAGEFGTDDAWTDQVLSELML